MEHNELAEALATRVAGEFDFETLLQMAYEVLAEDYKECSREGLLQEMEDIKEKKEVKVDDLIEVAESNIEFYLPRHFQRKETKNIKRATLKKKRTQ